MVKSKWSEENIEVLKEKYPTTKVSELTELLPFTDTQIRRKAKLLGLKKSDDGYEFAMWSKDDELILASSYLSHSVSEIKKILKDKFTEQQIKNKVHRMGLSKTNKWTKELENYLLKNYKKKTIAEMKNEKLNKFTETAIYRKLLKLGIKLSENDYWNEDEVSILKKYYALKTNSEMLELLPRFTKNQIKEKARHLKLKKLPLISYKAKIENNYSNVWGDDEKRVLIEYYGKLPNKKIQEQYLPHRSVSAIKNKANNLQLRDNLKYNYEWHITNCTHSSEEPYSIMVKLTKRRMDQ